MGVSKRLRFEVLKRDGYACRYCHATDNPLTIDHVVPVALGGTDEPDNLVAACRDCNAGKSSTPSDAETVASVAEDAVRWAKAMQEATRQDEARRQQEYELDDKIAEILDERWHWWVPENWAQSVRAWLAAGLTLEDFAYAVEVASDKRGIDSRFRYLMGVCKGIVSKRQELARKLIEDGEVE